MVGAVESVLDQSHRDFELIVVDDGSTDGTERALAGFADRIRCERQEQRGAAAARNTGLRAARGAIVAFLDSDNLWERDHLAVVAAMLRERPEAVLASTCPGFVTAGRAGPGDAVTVDPLPRLLAANFVGLPSCIAVRRITRSYGRRPTAGRRRPERKIELRRPVQYAYLRFVVPEYPDPARRSE